MNGNDDLDYDSCPDCSGFSTCERCSEYFKRLHPSDPEDDIEVSLEDVEEALAKIRKKYTK